MIVNQNVLCNESLVAERLWKLAAIWEQTTMEGRVAAAVAGLPPAVRTVLLIAAMFACYGGAALLQVCFEGSDGASRGVPSPCCFSSPCSWSRRPLAGAPPELLGGGGGGGGQES